MVDEEELEKLREEKMKERMEDQERETQQDAEEDRKKQIKQMAAKYLTKDARSRLGTLRTAKPDLASTIELQIAQLGRSGQIDKITDEELKDMLKEVEKQKSKEQDFDIKHRY